MAATTIDDDLLLAAAESAFRRLADDPHMLAAYRSQTREIEGAFETAAPDW